MTQWYILSLFLYFPEDKSEYIPAGITCAIFLAAALLTMRLIIRISKKEAEKAKELENRLMQQHNDPKNN